MVRRWSAAVLRSARERCRERRVGLIGSVVVFYLADALLGGSAQWRTARLGSAPVELLHATASAALWIGILLLHDTADRDLVVAGASIAALACDVVLLSRQQSRLNLRVARILVLASLALESLLVLSANPEPAAASAAAAAPAGTANGTAAEPASKDGKKKQKKKSEDDDEGDKSESDEETKRIKKRRKERLQTAGWLGYLRDYAVLVPILDPSGHPTVLAFMAVIMFCVVSERVLNVMVPYQLGVVTNRLLATGADAASAKLPYRDLFVWMALELFGSNGVVVLRRLVVVPLRAHAYRCLTTASFRHVMGLSQDFHSERDTAEVIKALGEGNSITNMFDWVMIWIGPAMFDVLIGLVFLYRKFGAGVLQAVIAAAILIICTEVYGSRYNRKTRRRMNRAERDMARAMSQAISGWQTVSHLNMITFETDRHAAAVDSVVELRRSWGFLDTWLDAAIAAGAPTALLLLSVMVFGEIAAGRSTPGDFVFLLQYWNNFVGPLKYLSWQCRYMMRELVDAERILELFQLQPTIADRAGAATLSRAEVGGRVAFNQVGFSYDGRKPTLQDISFEVLPGQTVAFVGTTGAGKSSIIKLLMRFYDASSGAVVVDGRDVRDLTLHSLRSAIGIVPQDPFLFNTSILENVRYARPAATDEEVHAACRAAAIHDNIVRFTDGYDTKVGERGVKLSGGELQRVAIARAFLRDAPILVLDEATSAVDSETEAEIQAALEALRRCRTTLVIAHRLSTIRSADCIMVVDEGRIVERGTHDELIARGGRYDKLWSKQIGLATGETGDGGADENAAGEKAGGAEKARNGDGGDGNVANGKMANGDVPNWAAANGDVANGNGKVAGVKVMNGTAAGKKPDDLIDLDLAEKGQGQTEK